MPRRGTPSTRKPGSSGSMRRGGRPVGPAGVSTLVLVALWGAFPGPGSDSDDRRLSTYLAGPSGAKGLAQALRRLGVTVEQRRRPYFDIATDSSRGRRERLYAFLDIDRPTTQELVAIREIGRASCRERV